MGCYNNHMARIVKKTTKIQEYQLPLTITRQEEGGFLARCEQLPGCMAEGETVSEALANIVDVAANLIDLYTEKEIPIKLKLVKQSSIKSPLQLDISLPYQLA